MSAVLSRRVAKLMDADVMYALTLDQRNDLAKTVNAAADFADLPKVYQDLILKAEQQTKTKEMVVRFSHRCRGKA